MAGKQQSSANSMEECKCADFTSHLSTEDIDIEGFWGP